MTYKFIWLPEKRPDIREKEKQKGVQYRVRINYKIFPEVRSNYLFLKNIKLNATIIEISWLMNLMQAITKQYMI